MKPEQVPTGVAAVFDAVWEMTRRTDKALAAALNAWPGKDIVGYGPPFYGIDLILPLNTENTNDT